MNHNPSRSQKREAHYTSLKDLGKTSTMEYLYKSEKKKLEAANYVVHQIGTHPTYKNLLFCEVIFPQDQPEN